jgi:hypothetical protein
MLHATTDAGAERTIGRTGLTTTLLMVVLSLSGGLALNQNMTSLGVVFVVLAVAFVVAVWIRSGSNDSGRLAAVGQAALWATALYGIGLFLAPAALGAACFGRDNPGIAAFLVATPTVFLATIQLAVAGPLNGPVVLGAVGLASVAIVAFSHSFVAASTHPE